MDTQHIPQPLSAAEEQTARDYIALGTPLGKILGPIFAIIDASRARIRELEEARAYHEARAERLSVRNAEYGADLDRLNDLATERYADYLDARTLAAEMAEALTRARVAVVTWSPNPTEPLTEIDTALDRYHAQVGGDEAVITQQEGQS